MVEIKNLSFNYDNKIIFKETDFQWLKNEITVISGPNGSGKTTFGKLLSGIILPDKKKKHKLIKEKILFLPQDLDNYILSDNYGDNQIFRKNAGLDSGSEAFKIIEYFIDYKKVPYSCLSFGEKKLLSYFLYYASNYDGYIFDEPFSSLKGEPEKIMLKLIELIKEKNKYLLIISPEENFDYFREKKKWIIKDNRLLELKNEL